MKNLKNGFTLAEVLISLTVIGIISAITLPTTLSNYQAKTVGVKLTKFASQLESSALSYVADYGSFDSISDASKFLNKSFLVKRTASSSSASSSSSSSADLLNANKYQNSMQNVSNQKSEITAKQQLVNIAEDKINSIPSSISVLRDGTGITALNDANLSFEKHKDVVDKYKVGVPMFIVKFYPNVKGLPSFAQQNFNFVVTELGYVYPHDDDSCLWALYNNDYVTTSDTYAAGSACVADETSSGSGTTGKVDFTNLEKLLQENVERAQGSFSN